MAYVEDTGYTKPGGDLALTHARVLHKGNRQRIKTVLASAEAAGFPGSAANIGTTHDKWKPFANLLPKPLDYSGSDWVKDGVTVGGDGQTLTEDTSTGFHRISDFGQTFTAAEYVTSFTVQRQTTPEIRVIAFDGTDTFGCYFDLRDGTVGTAVNGAVGQIVDLGDDTFRCSIYYTPLAAVGHVGLRGSTGAESENYTGDVTNTIRVLEATWHLSVAQLRMDSFVSASADMFCIAGHNLFSGAGRIHFQHDFDDNDVFSTIDTITVSDDSPIMFLFVPINSSRWRIQVDRCVLPEIAVMRVGLALQFEQPIHDGMKPFETNRNTSLRGNMGETGEFLGRARISTSLSGSVSWPRLTPGWVRSNLDGPGRLIDSVEQEPFFLAWRPATYAEAHYCWTPGPVAGPQFVQRPNLMNFALQCEALGYE